MTNSELLDFLFAMIMLVLYLLVVVAVIYDFAYYIRGRDWRLHFFFRCR